MAPPAHACCPPSIVPMLSEIPCPHPSLPGLRLPSVHSAWPLFRKSLEISLSSACSCPSRWLVHRILLLPRDPADHPFLWKQHTDSVFSPPSLANLPSPLGPSNVSRHTTRALAPVSCLFSSKFQFPGCKYQGNVSVSSDTDSRSSCPPPVLSHVSWQVGPHT